MQKDQRLWRPRRLFITPEINQIFPKKDNSLYLIQLITLRISLLLSPSLHFSKTRKLWSSQAAFTIVFLAAVNYNYDHKQRTLKHRSAPNGWKSTNHKSQTVTFWTRWRKYLFPKRFVNMIDGSEKCKLQLAFELQNSRFFEKRSNTHLYRKGSIPV